MSIVVTGANRHDVTQVENVLASRVRRPRGRKHQNLCADAGYNSEEARTIMRKYGYVPHVRSRCEEKKELAAGGNTAPATDGNFVNIPDNIDDELPFR